ncbi:MAG TPA: HD domain-containing phosphohydrolase [Candidatus Binatia bacterium]|nr:HD domain-containing phosphohydrolase [Candidatus Binatia bacterium]
MISALKKNKVNAILAITESLNRIKDIDSLLDRVLFEARRFCRADAGSIYLLENQKLRINFVQNDTLAKKASGKKYLYQNHALEINDRSMAGYVALTKKPLVIADAYQLSDDIPYQFNRSFDKSASYLTRSVLTVPLITNSGKLIGVMQIINACDEKNNRIPFSNEDELVVAYFANHATACIEKAKMTREIILRMIKIAELHDPEETGGHVNRVGAYAIEIYSAWALNHGVNENEIKNVRDILRIAAMLHDVGKVAISDLLLKKTGPLNDAEFNQMKGHVIMGARLFKDSTSDWDDMAAEIALNHHEKWDGTGYPGNVPDIFVVDWHGGPGKKGNEIPLPARIVALADVYDALTSQRAYKDCWPEEKVLQHIRAQKGKHFDPELVNIFFSIYDVIRAIKNKYNEN